jgi:hypothetical protein
VALLFVIERPDSNEIRDGRNRSCTGENVLGSQGKGIKLVGCVNNVSRPASPRARHDSDVILIIAIVDAEGKKLQQLARIIFVGNVLGVAAAVYRVQVDDHGGAFGADEQQIIEGALWIQQSLAPFLVFL